KLVEDYCKANLLWRKEEELIQYSSVVELVLGSVEATVSGPKRPQDKILVKDFKPKFGELLQSVHGREYIPIDKREEVSRFLEEGGAQTEDQSDAKAPAETEIKTRIKNGLKSVSVKLHNDKFELYDG